MSDVRRVINRRPALSTAVAGDTSHAGDTPHCSVSCAAGACPTQARELARLAARWHGWRLCVSRRARAAARYSCRTRRGWRGRAAPMHPADCTCNEPRPRAGVAGRRESQTRPWERAPGAGPVGRRAGGGRAGPLARRRPGHARCQRCSPAPTQKTRKKGAAQGARAQNVKPCGRTRGRRTRPSLAVAPASRRARSAARGRAAGAAWLRQPPPGPPSHGITGPASPANRRHQQTGATS